MIGALFVHVLVFAFLFNHVAVAGVGNADLNDPAQSKIWQAVQNGDAGTVKLLLDDKNHRPALRGQNCNSSSICNLISYAAENGNVEIIRLLQRAGSPVDEPDGGSGDMPLMRALFSRHIQAAEYLAEHGADPLRTNRFGVPEFIVAAGMGSPRLLETMIKLGAPVDLPQAMPDMINPKDSQLVPRRNPTDDCSHSGRIDLIKTLLDYGADPSLRDGMGRDIKLYIKSGQSPSIEAVYDTLIESRTARSGKSIEKGNGQ